jgi:hypothetical protein
MDRQSTFKCVSWFLAKMLCIGKVQAGDEEREEFGPKAPEYGLP